jgi:hypothetical protein
VLSLPFFSWSQYIFLVPLVVSALLALTLHFFALWDNSSFCGLIFFPFFDKTCAYQSVPSSWLILCKSKVGFVSNSLGNWISSHLKCTGKFYSTLSHFPLLPSCQTGRVAPKNKKETCWSCAQQEK